MDGGEVPLSARRAKGHEKKSQRKRDCAMQPYVGLLELHLKPNFISSAKNSTGLLLRESRTQCVISISGLSVWKLRRWHTSMVLAPQRGAFNLMFVFLFYYVGEALLGTFQALSQT